ncbi:MAG: Ig-like domain-containing protein [Armatimonadota bacterium]
MTACNDGCPRRRVRQRAAPVKSTIIRALTALVALLVCATAFAQAPRVNGVRLNLWPTPRVVPADGKTESTIRAELRDQSGLPAPDGTTVVFRVEGGDLSLDGNERRQVVSTETVNGAATVFVTSTETGTATIYAELTSGEGQNRVSIAFVEEGSSLLGGAGVVHVRGNWVGYAVDLGIVEARDDAEVEFAGVSIVSPDVIQVDVNSLTVKAMNAAVESPAGSIEADEISYNLLSGQGTLRRMGETGYEELCFDCFTLQLREPDFDLATETFRLDTGAAAVWAVARGVSVHPQEKIVLRHATLYAGGRKVTSLPKYWIIAMPGYAGTTHSRVLGVNSSGELAVDFPYFYRVSETQTSAIKLQHGASSGRVIARDDWSLALEESYDTGLAQGSVSLVGLPRNDWGLEWRDQRNLGGRRDGYFTVYSPDHESWYADANVYEITGDRRLNLTATVQKPASADFSYAVGADWLSMNRPLGMWNASYRLGTSAGLRHIDGLDSGLVAENQLYAAIDLPRRHLSERASITPAFSNLFTWDTSGYRYNTLRGELRLRQIVSSDKSLSMSYRADFSSGDSARGYRHSASLDLRAYHGRRLSGYATTTYDLSDSRFYGFGLVDYTIDDMWRLGLSGTYYDLAEGSYDDIQVSVARKLGPTEIGLRWSEASGRVSLELGDFTGLGM